MLRTKKQRQDYIIAQEEQLYCKEPRESVECTDQLHLQVYKNGKNVLFHKHGLKYAFQLPLLVFYNSRYSYSTSRQFLEIKEERSQLVEPSH